MRTPETPRSDYHNLLFERASNEYHEYILIYPGKAKLDEKTEPISTGVVASLHEEVPVEHEISSIKCYHTDNRDFVAR